MCMATIDKIQLIYITFFNNFVGHCIFYGNALQWYSIEYPIHQSYFVYINMKAVFWLGVAV